MVALVDLTQVLPTLLAAAVERVLLEQIVLLMELVVLAVLAQLQVLLELLQLVPMLLAHMQLVAVAAATVQQVAVQEALVVEEMDLTQLQQLLEQSILAVVGVQVLVQDLKAAAVE
jgi:hypothetical protein